MNITRETIKETLRTIMAEETEYQTFFKKALEKAGKSIPSMSDEEKKEFFNKIDAAWNAKGEKNEGNAFGAAVTAAKEKGEDEFEVGGKTYKVEESASCSCGCGTCSEAVNEGKFKVDDLVYNKRTKTVGIVRIGDDKYGEVKTDADGNVDVDELEKYNPIKFKHQSKAKAAPSTQKEVSKRGLFNPFKNESVNEAATDRDFEKVFNLFNKKDYFHLKGSIKTMLGNWQRALDRGDKGAQQYSKEDIIDSVTTQTKARAKNTYDELVKAIKNKDIKSLKSKLRHDQKFSLAIFTQLTGKKLPKSTRDIHSFLDNEFMNESITEGRKSKDGTGVRFAQAVYNNVQAIEELVVDDKKDPKEVIPVMAPVLLNAINACLKHNYKPNAQPAYTLKRDLQRKGDYTNQQRIDIFKKSLMELKKIVESLIKKPSKVGVKNLVDAHRNWWNHKYGGNIALNGQGPHDNTIIEGRAFINAARKAKEEGKTEFEFNGKTYPVTLKEESINERRLGKVSMLKDIESGDTSRVEGVKISPELAFELRMFLQRPMLARTRTGIAIDNAQMKDAIGMLAKVGVEKRLSSGVKNEFSNLLKKYNK